tara:strand:+ start:229 stop:459 length:231 start_codon:yes stop_codon:yes gene_type:complete
MSLQNLPKEILKEKDFTKIMKNELVWQMYEDFMYEGKRFEWETILEKLSIKQIIKLAEKNAEDYIADTFNIKVDLT